MITLADPPSRPAITGARRTIARSATVQGIGLHLGKPCTLVFTPAATGAGINFVRGDRPDSAPIPARVGSGSPSQETGCQITDSGTLISVLEGGMPGRLGELGNILQKESCAQRTPIARNFLKFGGGL